MKSFCEKCIYCNRYKSKPFPNQMSNDLPNSRVQSSFAFQSSGVDYLRPVFVKPIFSDIVLQSFYKVEIVLLTCAATPAVHLDIVPDYSATSFVKSLKRFIASRGIPNLFLSENAIHFKNDEVKLSQELFKLNIKWHYIIEASPWWGGFWERLVQTVKRTLRKILGRATVNYEDLLTIINEIEGMINSRPLVYVNTDDVHEILTPEHLIYGRLILSEQYCDIL